MRDRGSSEDNTWLTAITGKPGFSSGKHYWEVSLFAPKIEPKQSWWLGVAHQDSIPLVPTSSPVGPNFWFLSSSNETPNQLHLITKDSEASVPVSSRPQSVGVFLDYEAGKLTFYDVEKQTFIGSLTAKFKGEMFPLFNPGAGDKSPMTILERTVKKVTPETPLIQEAEC